MTDRHAAYIVILSDDIREDDAKWTINALRMVKDMKSVQPVMANFEMKIAQRRADREWHDRIRALLKEAS